MRKVLLVGASSGLAQSLKPRLAKHFEVVTAGRQGSEVLVDLESDEDWPPLTGSIDCVINCAAAFRSSANGRTLERVNVTGALRLLEWSEALGADHFVQISSMSAGLSPDSRLHDDYAVTKRRAELLLLEQTVLRKHIAVAILRPPQLYGGLPGQLKHRGFLRAAFECASRGHPVRIVGTHDAKRNYMAFDDFAEVVAHACLRRSIGLRTCTFSHDVRFSEVAAAVCRALGREELYYHSPSESDLEDVVAPFSGEFYSEVGFEPTIDLEEGLKSIVAAMMWHRSSLV